MKGYLIDPEEKVVTEVQVAQDYHDIYHHLKCEAFTLPIILENEDGVYCDDEGLLHGPTKGFHMSLSDGTEWVLAGRGLVLGGNKETGESEDARSTIEEIRTMITSWHDEPFMEIYKEGIGL